MNAHERFNLILSHNLPDRLPVDRIWPRIETIDLLKQHRNYLAVTEIEFPFSKRYCFHNDRSY